MMLETSPVSSKNPTLSTSVRFPVEVLEAVDAARTEIEARTGVEASRNAVIVALVRRGLALEPDPETYRAALALMESEPRLEDINAALRELARRGAAGPPH